MSEQDYHSTRLKEDARRDVLWSVLAGYLQRYVPTGGSVLDFGAGYCGFINFIAARRKIAFDRWDGIRRHAQPSVECLVGHYDALGELGENSLDAVFASNIFEHFEVEELEKVVAVIHRVLKPGGRLICLQPNYYYAYRQYFDDYTHKSVWTHRSLPDFLQVNKYGVVHTSPAFLPLTVKSRLPVHPILIKGYIWSPFKPMAGQMLVVAEAAK